MRIFIALLLPEHIRRELVATAQVIQPSCSKGNFSDPENYHLTLRFLGECSEEQIIKLQQIISVLATNSHRFSLSLGPCGSFPKGNQQIIWRGLIPPYEELQLLVKKLDLALDNAGWPPENRTFRPHLTLARQAILHKPLSQIALPHSSLEFTASQIAVMESCRINGQLTYLPLAVSPLV